MCKIEVESLNLLSKLSQTSLTAFWRRNVSLNPFSKGNAYSDRSVGNLLSDSEFDAT